MFGQALLVAFVLAALACPAAAWSTKEHIQLTRLAVMRLLADESTPAEMRAWLKTITPDLTDMAAEKRFFMSNRIGAFPRGADGVSFWAVAPDLHAAADPPESTVAPFGVHEKLLHYIDLELLHPDQSKRTYKHDLSHKPALADIPRDRTDPRYKTAGMLPFRIEDCYKRLVEQIRLGRLADKPGQFPRDEHAQKWAGYLAHYLADNTQPQHNTIDYKSATYFPGIARPPNAHADVEYRLCDDEYDDYPALREKFWASFVQALEQPKPAVSGDLWESSLRVSLISYDALPMIGRAAAAAYPRAEGKGRVGPFDAEKFFLFEGAFLGRKMTVLEMKAHQMAWAVDRIASVWRQAWEEAHKPQDNPPGP